MRALGEMEVRVSTEKDSVVVMSLSPVVLLARVLSKFCPESVTQDCSTYLSKLECGMTI